ncbi:MAG: hypothetical protein R3C15_16225 [Thermoleophilia bacterium]
MRDPQRERLARELTEDLRRLRVEEIVGQMLMTLESIAYRRLGLTADALPDRDLDQVRVAIETMDALIPVIERSGPAELAQHLRSSGSHLKLSYAEAARQAAQAGPGAGAA